MAIGYKLSAFIPRCIVSTTYTAQILSAVLKAHLANELPIGKDVISSGQVCDIAFAMSLSEILLLHPKQASIQ